MYSQGAGLLIGLVGVGIAIGIAITASPTDRKDLIGQNCNWCAPLHNTVNAVTRMMAAFTYFCVEEFPLITPPLTDDAIPGYLKSLGVPGIIDLHVHFMPDRVQQKVWGFFDHLAEMGESPWPIAYRYTDHQRVEILRNMGVTAYSTLNYAHRPGMAAFLNEYSKTFAAEHKDAIHSATFYPEPGVEAMVGQVLDERRQDLQNSYPGRWVFRTGSGACVVMGAYRPGRRTRGNALRQWPTSGRIHGARTDI